MEANKILSASLIDVIFDGRNKEYGAYELRKTYSGREKAALSVTLAVAALIFAGVTMASSSKKKEAVYKISATVDLANVADEKIPEKLPEPEVKPEQVQVKEVKLTTPVIVDKDKIDEPMATVEDLKDAIVGIDPKEGIPDDGTVKGPENIGDKKGIIEDKPEAKDEPPFRSVEVAAKFIGDWRKFLEKNLNPETPNHNGAGPGRYTVVIEFVVDKTGSVSDITPLTHHGYGLEEEAIRVLKKAPKWEPAIQNGVPVKAYHRQLITFEVLGEE